MAKLTKGSIKRVTVDDLEQAQPIAQKKHLNLKKIFVILGIAAIVLVLLSGALYFYARSSAYHYLASGNSAKDSSEYTVALQQYNLAAQFALIAPQLARNAQLAQVEIYRQKGNHTEALKILQKLHAENPNDQEVIANLGVVALGAEDFSTAEAALQSLDLSYSQDVAEARGVLGLLNITASTATLFDEILQKYPNSDLAHYYKGLLIAMDGDESGLAELNKIAKTNAVFTDRVVNFSAQYQQIFVKDKSSNAAYQAARVGMALLAINEPALAVKKFNDALALEPDYRDALLFKAESLKQLHHYEEAKAAFTVAIDRDPSFALSHDLAGRLAVLMSDYTQCKNEFARAETLGQNTADFYYNVALCDRGQGDFTAAVTHLEKSLALNNHNIAAHRERFWLFKDQLGTPDDAALQAQSMVVAFPDLTEPTALDAIAVAKSDPERAKRDLAVIVKREPQSPWRYFVEATLESDSSEAQKLFIKAIDADRDGQVSAHAPENLVEKGLL